MGYIKLAVARDNPGRFFVDKMIDEVARDCVLYLPLRKLPGDSFLSRDAYGHLVTRNGDFWTPQGDSFDGVDDFMDLGSPTSLQITAAITIESWVKKRTVNTYDVIVANGAISGESYEVFGGDSAANALMFINPTTALTSGNVFYTVDDWINTVWTYSDADNKAIVYKNGVLFEQWTTAAAMGTSTGNTNIGRRPNADHPFDGIIGEVRIYSRALGAVEIQQHYLATRRVYQ